MKTLQEIQKLIDDDRAEAERLQKNFHSSDEETQKESLKRIKRLRSNISYHEEIKLCLLDGPSKEHLEKEEGRIRRRLSLIHEGYKTWSDQNKLPFKNETEKLNYFNKVNGVPDLKRHLKNTMFILN